MPSPFPGMDPYLGRFWLSVHNTLVTYLTDELNTRFLPPDLRADITERVHISSPDESYRRRIPSDLYVVESAPGGGGTAPVVAAGAVALAEPVILRLPDDPVIETAIRITDLTGATLVTAIEVLSASNKFPGPDRDLYLRKRNEYYAGGVNTVEIDLFRGGERTVAGVDIDAHLRPERRSPYLVIVWRARRWDEWELYPLPLRRRLPAFRIPLRPSDPDVIFDIQPVLDRAYANGRHPIDYTRDPDPPLEGGDAAWADELLRAAGRR